jgi:hypothetical protein
MRAPKSAENTKSIAMNSSPLPRNTVARNLSSVSPMREPARAHEPQEEDAAERHQAKRELDLAAAACLGQPRTGVMRVGGHDPAEQDDNEPEQDGKDNPGQAGSTRRPEHSWRNLICRPTRHITHPES